jgi:hypothetical protein
MAPYSPRALAALATVMAIATSGCGTPGPDSAALPDDPTPCASHTAPTPSPTPTETKLPWRAEELPDGSLRMTVGDIDAAPDAPRTRGSVDYRAPADTTECDEVRIAPVKGWWCVTTVQKVAESGEIVVGGAEPRAEVHSAGFGTRCSGRPGAMRQAYRFERDSWSAWRPYSHTLYTQWTNEQRQDGGRVSVPCPSGRVGTYNYHLWVQVDIEGLPVGDSGAASARIRADCGTGVS